MISTTPEDGSWDIEKANPLMMVESDRGMHFCTVRDITKFEPYGAMFPDGKDPLAWMYEKRGDPRMKPKSLKILDGTGKATSSKYSRFLWRKTH
jgi:hypothetical protein